MKTKIRILVEAIGKPNESVYENEISITNVDAAQLVALSKAFRDAVQEVIRKLPSILGKDVNV